MLFIQSSDYFPKDIMNDILWIKKIRSYIDNIVGIKIF